MRDTLSFFKWLFADLPLNHFIVVACNNKYTDPKTGAASTYWTHINNATPEEAAKTAHELVVSGKDVFYAIGMFADNLIKNDKGKIKPSRKKIYSKFLQELVLDIDCGAGKPYADVKHGQKETEIALGSLGFKPDEYALVCSGGGVHVHIKLEDPVIADYWSKLAAKFKNAILSTNLKIDVSKTLDVALVLRPVGTQNLKQVKPRAVEWLKEPTGVLTFERAATLLDKFDVRPELLQNYTLNAYEAAFNGVEIPDDLPESSIDLGKRPEQLAPAWEDIRCAQLLALEQDCNVPEPLWYQALGVAAYTNNPRAAAIAWSQKYDHYNERHAISKMAQYSTSTTGPATCATFSNLQPELCRKCAYRNIIKTPLHAIAEVKEQTVKLTIEGKPEQIEYTLPPEYRVTPEKTLVKIVDGMEYLISTYLIFLTSIARHSDERDPKTYLRLAVHLPHVVEYLELSAASLFGGNKGGESYQAKLAQMGVAMRVNQFKLVGDYLIDSYHHFQKNHREVKMLASFGWLPDCSGYVWGNKLIRGGMKFERVIAANNTMRKLSEEYKSKGSLEKWKEAMSLFNTHGVEPLAFGVLLGFATPLYTFTKLQGVCVNFYSEDTGSGKSTACFAAQSIYGRPQGLTMGKGSSNAGIFLTLGTIKNLPALMDEVSDSEGSRISSLLYAIATGKEDSKSEVSGDLRNIRYWSLVFMMTSNKSMHDKLAEHTQSSAGQKARLLEIQYDRNEIIDKIGAQINITIDENYGHAALPYLSRLVDGYKDGELIKLIKNGVEEFDQRFGFRFTANERFIAGAVIMSWIGGVIAKDCGLIDWDIDRIIQKTIDVVKDNRAKALSEAPVIENIIGDFLTENYRYTIHNKNYDNVSNLAHCIVPDQFKARMDVLYHSTGHMTNNQNYHPISALITIPVKVFKDYCRINRLPFGSMENALSKLKEYSKGTIAMTHNLSVKETLGGLPIVSVASECYKFVLSAQQLDTMKAKHTQVFVMDTPKSADSVVIGNQITSPV